MDLVSPNLIFYKILIHNIDFLQLEIDRTKNIFVYLLYSEPVYWKYTKMYVAIRY